MAKIKLKKTLYVGLGGTGVATLLKVKKHFIDSYGEVPPMIGFLAIDTDKSAISKAETSNMGVKISLDPSELLVCSVIGALNVYRANPKIYDWVPGKNVDKLVGIAGNGAGQVRSNGRFIAFYNNEKIKNGIHAAVNKICKLIPLVSRYEVDIDKDGVAFPVEVNVMASVAGGTGSGMLIDVLCLINESLKLGATPYYVYPWIVLPDVFKVMASGPMMGNVNYNAYGALRSLDYLVHHDPNDHAIDFGYAKITEKLFDYAFVINNKNTTGVTFNDISDIADVMAKSVFLPANEMGAALDAPFDNIRRNQEGGVYDIRKKRAWVTSVGSAELIYDGKAVASAIAHSLVSLLCDSMLQAPGNGTDDANRFFDDQNVMIRENLGRDDIIDTLLSPAPAYTLQIDKQTTISDIETYINGNTMQLEPELQAALGQKIENTKKYFNEYIVEIMSRPQGKVDGAIKFILALKEIIAICKGEMESEMDDFHRLNQVPNDWAPYVRDLKGWLGMANQTGIEVLQQKVVEVVTNRREETRRAWALKFYNSIESVLEKKMHELEALKNVIKEVAKENTNALLSAQYNSKSNSKFQMFLHEKDLLNVSALTIDDSMKTAFASFLGNGVASWIGQTQEYIQRKLWSFVESTANVQGVAQKNIDDVLRGMPQEEVENYLERMKILAAPMWTYNTLGFEDTVVPIDRHIIVGVGNRDNSYLKEDALDGFFDATGNRANYASTYQYDRIYVMIVEDLLPIYAVNNFMTYKADAEAKIQADYRLANYLDEKLNNRMNAEGFDMLPKIEADNVLKFWTYGFVFDFIHFDTNTNQYWIRSKSKGDAIDNFRFNLSHQRDVAFDIFKSEQLSIEVEEALNKQIALHGKEPIERKLNDVRARGNYRSHYANLSPLEANNLTEPKFKAVRDLLAREITLMTD